VLGAQARTRCAFPLRAPGQGIGPHLRRRAGQSLEFREFRDYAPGEDIRKVDWAASRRRGGKWDLVARSFEAEERRTLLILIDCRPAMRLPNAVPKLGVATWIAGCLIEAALAEGDRVFVAPVFAPGCPVLSIAGRDGQRTFRAMMADLLGGEDWEDIPAAGLDALRRKHLPPAGSVVLISDMLFDDSRGGVAQFIRQAQRGFRSFHMIELDSWPCERAVLGAMPFRLLPLGGASFDDRLADAPDAYLSEVTQAIAARRRDLRSACSGKGFFWPAEPMAYPNDPSFDADAARGWFQPAFAASPAVRDMMTRAR
jgi:uncharacterized protein (DUF58 family)